MKCTSITHSEHEFLKCNGTQGNAVPPPPIYGSKRSPQFGQFEDCQRTNVTG